MGSHRVARVSLVGLEGLIGVSAVYGGVGLMANGMGMPQDWLDGTPFPSWVLPGVALLVVVAVPMLVAAWLELACSPRAYAASVVAGGLQVGWIVVQLVVLRRYFFLQPVLGVLGALVLLLAWAVHHERPAESPAAGSGAAQGRLSNRP